MALKLISSNTRSSLSRRLLMAKEANTEDNGKGIADAGVAMRRNRV
jgi:hypothetical protein